MYPNLYVANADFSFYGRGSLIPKTTIKEHELCKSTDKGIFLGRASGYDNTITTSSDGLSNIGGNSNSVD